MNKERFQKLTGENWPVIADEIPEHMMHGLLDWIEHGVSGDFIRAVMNNDLAEAVARADDTNVLLLPQYVKLVYNYFPAPCWGSIEKVQAWQDKKAKNLLESEA